MNLPLPSVRFLFKILKFNHLKNKLTTYLGTFLVIFIEYLNESERLADSSIESFVLFRLKGSYNMRIWSVIYIERKKAYIG